MNNLSLLKSPKDIKLMLAKRIKQRRKFLDISQKELGERSGVSLGSVRRFEQMGDISLMALIKISNVLDCMSDFDDLFVRKQYNTAEEIIDDYENF